MVSEPKQSQQTTRGAPKVDYIDRPDLAETFSDSIQSVTFDGQSLRINFCVTRLNEMRPDQAATAKRYPACRLVLSPLAAIDLINQMQRISAALSKAGVLKPAGGSAVEGKTAVQTPRN